MRLFKTGRRRLGGVAAGVSMAVLALAGAGAGGALADDGGDGGHDGGAGDVFAATNNPSGPGTASPTTRPTP